MMRPALQPAGGPAMPSLLDIIGHLSYGIAAVSFLVRDITMLRMLAIASCALSIVFYFMMPAGPLWLPMSWVTLYILINVAQIVRLYLESRMVHFSPEEKELHE